MRAAYWIANFTLFVLWSLELAKYHFWVTLKSLIVLRWQIMMLVGISSRLNSTVSLHLSWILMIRISPIFIRVVIKHLLSLICFSLVNSFNLDVLFIFTSSNGSRIKHWIFTHVTAWYIINYELILLWTCILLVLW